jgi:EmrB/QacA subfamily drug resistance transporter
MVGLDATIVNVALPSIHRSLHAPVSGLQWTVDAYTLVVASLLMLAGSTADRIGRRRVFQTGLVVFSTGSLLCALAPSLNALIAFRVLQAVGASMLNPVAMSIIRNTFDDPRERAQAIGLWGGVAGVSFALGPILGGILIQLASWRWVFLVNLPVGIASVTLTALYVPESRAPHARRLDPIGQLVVIVGLASLTYAIIEGPGHGWTSAEILTLFGTAVVATVALIVYELRRDEPLIDPRFFKSAPLSGATVIAVCAFAALGGSLFLNTLYLQDVRHLSPLHAGMYLLPLAAMTIVFGPLSGRLVASRGARPSLVAGGLAITISALMFTQLTDTTSTPYLLAANLVFGIGFGLVNPPITNTAVAGMPAAQAGVAAAVASTSRQVGSTLGVAIVGAIVSSGIVTAIGPGFAAATHPAWVLIVGLGVSVLVVGLVTTSRWAYETAQASARQLGAEPVLTGRRPSAPPVAG